MEFKEIAQALFQYGGTMVMAILFVIAWVFDKTKNNKIHEENNLMLKSLIESNKNVADSNQNIAKSLEIISNNLVTIDKKIDRNYLIEKAKNQ